MVPLPNPSFQPQSHWERPGAGAPSREVPFRNGAFCCPKQPFMAQNSPRTLSKQPNEGRSLLHSTWSDCPVTESSLLPSNSTTCPTSIPKRAKNCLNVHYLCQIGPKPRRGRILGYVAPNQIPRAPGPSATPHFLCFPGLKIAQREALTPVPVVTWWSRRASRPGHDWGSTVGPLGSRGEKKIFSEAVPRPLGMLKQLFVAHSEPLRTRTGTWKIPKCLEKGPLWHKRWV